MIADRHHVALQQWLAHRTGQDPAAVVGRIGSALADLLDELQEEYGRVSLTAIDPRYVSHFLLEDAPTGKIQT